MDSEKEMARLQGEIRALRLVLNLREVYGPKQPLPFHGRRY